MIGLKWVSSAEKGFENFERISKVALVEMGSVSEIEIGILEITAIRLCSATHTIARVAVQARRTTRGHVAV